tara:strand:- start:427 stop:1188 length:762 start_codon:yes stop_codon:yes gene_type:complete
MSTIAASAAAGSRISGSRSGGIGSVVGNAMSGGAMAALGLNNQQAAGAAPEPESTDPSYLSDANSAYNDAYSAMMDNRGPGGRANAQSRGLREAFNSAKEARDAARLRFKAEEAGMSPEEYSQDQVSQYGGGYGSRLGIGNMISQYGNVRNGVNAAQNQLVTDAQQSYTDNPSEQEPQENAMSKLRNPLGQELQPMMNAVGFKNSAITNAGKMFGQSYGGLFAGAAKKYKGPAHCNVDTMHTMYWNDMRKRNK